MALTVKLGLLERLVGARPRARRSDRSPSSRRRRGEALEELRDLARGIYPPLLADKGLVAALESQARKSAVPVTIEADGVGRYAREAEAAVYFSCLEALQNVAKYAAASRATVSLSDGDGRLRFEVTDDGVGFDPADVVVRHGAPGDRRPARGARGVPGGSIGTWRRDHRDRGRAGGHPTRGLSAAIDRSAVLAATADLAGATVVLLEPWTSPVPPRRAPHPRGRGRRRRQWTLHPRKDHLRSASIRRWIHGSRTTHRSPDSLGRRAGHHRGRPCRRPACPTDTPAPSRRSRSAIVPVHGVVATILLPLGLLVRHGVAPTGRLR